MEYRQTKVPVISLKKLAGSVSGRPVTAAGLLAERRTGAIELKTPEGKIAWQDCLPHAQLSFAYVERHCVCTPSRQEAT